MSEHEIIFTDASVWTPVDIDALSDRLGISTKAFAETAGVPATALKGMLRRDAERMTEMAEIIHRVAGWAGGERQALAWYRAEPLPAFGGRTAEGIVKGGKAAALRDYLDHLALGGFA